MGSVNTSEESSTFPRVAGANLESLLRGIEAIYADLGDPGTDIEEEYASVDLSHYGPPLDPAAEAQILAVLTTLRRIGAAARHGSTLPPPPPSALYGALGGAAMLMYSDFLGGRGDELPGRLAAFAYLTTLIFMDRADAERRGREVEALIEAEGFNADVP
jgi:hypothetical protein